MFPVALFRFSFLAFVLTLAVPTFAAERQCGDHENVAPLTSTTESASERACFSTYLPMPGVFLVEATALAGRTGQPELQIDEVCSDNSELRILNRRVGAVAVKNKHAGEYAFCVRSPASYRLETYFSAHADRSDPDEAEPDPDPLTGESPAIESVCATRTEGLAVFSFCRNPLPANQRTSVVLGPNQQKALGIELEHWTQIEVELRGSARGRLTLEDGFGYRLLGSSSGSTLKVEALLAPGSYTLRLDSIEGGSFNLRWRGQQTR